MHQLTRFQLDDCKDKDGAEEEASGHDSTTGTLSLPNPAYASSIQVNVSITQESYWVLTSGSFGR
jgi:hypothetical protein